MGLEWIRRLFRRAPKAPPGRLHVRFVNKPTIQHEAGGERIDTSWYEFFLVLPTDDGKAWRVLEWKLPAEAMGGLRHDWLVGVGDDGWTKEHRFPSGAYLEDHRK